MTGQAVGRVYVIPGHGTFQEGEAGKVPVPKDMPSVKGVFVGGCVARGIGRVCEKDSLTRAHAHTRGLHRGWVCFQLPKYLDDVSLRMHELAHIQTGEGHTKKWREAMERLGQEVPKRYLQKTQDSL